MNDEIKSHVSIYLDSIKVMLIQSTLSPEEDYLYTVET